MAGSGFSALLARIVLHSCYRNGTNGGMKETLALDDDGYPTEEALSRIEKWGHEAGFRPLMEAVRAIWRYADAGYWSEDGTEIHASTAGWSGNEDIICALERNTAFWVICWVQSRRGGHHIFDVKN